MPFFTSKKAIKLQFFLVNWKNYEQPEKIDFFQGYKLAINKGLSRKILKNTSAKYLFRVRSKF